MTLGLRGMIITLLLKLQWLSKMLQEAVVIQSVCCVQLIEYMYGNFRFFLLNLTLLKSKYDSSPPTEWVVYNHNKNNDPSNQAQWY